MLISEVLRYIKDRTGATDFAFLLAEVNRAMQVYWYQVDTTDAYQEIDVAYTTERFATLPWYVFQVKAVKSCSGERIDLYKPRAFYNDGAYQDSYFQHKVLHRTPLLQHIKNAGRLTARARKKLLAPVTITLKGPGDFGVVEWDDLTLNANTLQVESTSVFYDLTILSKSTITAADIEIRDNNKNVVAILPADRTDVWNILIQLFDKRTNICVPSNGAFTVLYKIHPPIFTRDTDAIAQEHGLVLQKLVSEELLRKDKSREAQAAASRHGADAVTLAANIANKDEEGKLRPMDISPAAHIHSYSGYL